jgi:crossover junction endodeoxyribonuclease RuvC
MTCRLALDLASHKTGWAVLINQSLSSGTIILNQKIPHHQRMRMLHQAISHLMDQYKPDMVVIEAVYGGRNIKTAILLAQYHGAAIVSIGDVPIQYITPSEWRKEYGIVGKRDDVKKQSVRIVADLYGLCVSDDEADAILICGVAQPRFPQEP